MQADRRKTATARRSAAHDPVYSHGSQLRPTARSQLRSRRRQLLAARQAQGGEGLVKRAGAFAGTFIALGSMSLLKAATTKSVSCWKLGSRFFI